MDTSLTQSDQQLEPFSLTRSVENNDEECGVPRRSDAGLSNRENGFLFKRFHSHGFNLDASSTNGDNPRALNQCGSQSKSHTVNPGRAERTETGGRKSRSWIYGILICFGIACFLVEALLQDSLMTFLKHNEFHAPVSAGVDLTAFKHLKSLKPHEVEKTLFFGDAVKFMPSKFLENKYWNPNAGNNLSDWRYRKRYPIRRPQLALVCSDLSRSPGILLLISVAVGLHVLGYDLELYSFEDGPMRPVWEKLGTPVNILRRNSQQDVVVDWLNFDGIIINSLEGKAVISSLMQEPFKEVPVIWIIHENGLGMRLRIYATRKLTEIIRDWKDAFHRANVVIFPDYTMAMLYSALDTGNFFVIPGSPSETWEAEHFMATKKREALRIQFGFDSQDFVILVVRSPFVYKGMWWEHALVMQAILPLMSEFKVEGRGETHLKLVVMSGNSTSTYGMALQAMSLQLGFPIGSVQHVGLDGSVNPMLSIADLVLYGSFREEQAFPAILVRAMSFEKPIIAPKLAIIQKYVKDGKHGILFPVGNVNMITKALLMAISNGRLSVLAHQLAPAGRLHAKNLLASDAAVGYAAVLENVLQFPSETVLPRPVSEIPEVIKMGWQWQLLEGSSESNMESPNQGLKESSMVSQVEELWRRHRRMVKFMSKSRNIENKSLSLLDWEEERAREMAEDMEVLEGEQLEERSDQPMETWEGVYRYVKMAKGKEGELLEIDDGEMERSGQSLCIYEPFDGPGTWPFLHRGVLYRGIGLGTKGCRAGADDVDAQARLPLLGDAYYREVLCEYGAYFAIANKIDDIHKNSWIGFQSWRATGRKVSLSATAEKELTAAIRRGRHGDAVYFWVRMDEDARNDIPGAAFQQEDFWSFCDAINAGNCRVVFSDAFKRVYNLPENWTAVPPMPSDRDSWSVLHSWAMPTSSFLELVMFARMFVDSLDAQHYEEHHDNGTCCLSISKMEGQHCYCRILELLVNVWAYHSARRMVYMNPETGVMQEQHKMEKRRGHMWLKWFNFSLLKSMDEDLAEEADYEYPAKRWIWPSTGEVFWQGTYSRQRQREKLLKMEKKRKKMEKLERMRSRYKRKSRGKHTRPPSQEAANSAETNI